MLFEDEVVMVTTQRMCTKMKNDENSEKESILLNKLFITYLQIMFLLGVQVFIIFKST